jgi:2-dehydropantoate 2-reductase
MRILILGAGALGGYFGARLLASGRDVTFLVRPGTAQQLAEHGLNVISPTHGDVHIAHPPTILSSDIGESFDVALISCKAYDIASAIDSIAPAVGPDSFVLPMLNGMAHMPVLDARFGPERVLGGTCFISAVREKDGTIRHLNDREGFFFGHRSTPGSAAMRRIEAALTNANFDGRLRPVILEDMWNKWGFVATLAGITCLMRATIGDIEAAGAAHLSSQLYSECVSIAAVAGYPPPAAFEEKHRGILTAPGSSMTASMLRDLEGKVPVESHQILGDLLDRARKHNLETPLLALAHAHVLCYERRSRREEAATA